MVLIVPFVQRLHSIVVYAREAQQIIDILNVWSRTASAIVWGSPPPFFHVLRFSGTPKVYFLRFSRTKNVDEVNIKWVWMCEGGMSRPLGQSNVFKVTIEKWDADTDDSDEIELVQTTVRGDIASTSHDNMFYITIGATVMHKVNQALVQAIENVLTKEKQE